MKLSAGIESRIDPAPFRTSEFLDEDPLEGGIKKSDISLSE
jgi:hypothetical protein